MLLFYILLFALTIYKAKFSKAGFFLEESLSRDVTDSVKGVFIWLVFFSHFSSYITSTAFIDTAGFRISTLLGQLIVACFLFYSGYGVCEAIKKRGYSYIKTFPSKRLFKTLLHFDLAVLLFLVLGFIIGQIYDIKTVLLGLIGWESLGNSNWYIFVVLVLYLITWLSFTVIKNNIKCAVLLVTALSGFLILFLYLTRWSWWYDTVLCYVLGLWVSVFKKEILGFISKNNIIWCICTASVIAIFLFLYKAPFNGPLEKLLSLLTAPAFCLVVGIILTKISVSNRILIFCGQYLFEIYILQRIPMILIKHFLRSGINIYLYFILCVVITVLLSLGFRVLTDNLDRLIFKKQ